MEEATSSAHCTHCTTLPFPLLLTTACHFASHTAHTSSGRGGSFFPHWHGNRAAGKALHLPTCKKSLVTAMPPCSGSPWPSTCLSLSLSPTYLSLASSPQGRLVALPPWQQPQLGMAPAFILILRNGHALPAVHTPGGGGLQCVYSPGLLCICSRVGFSAFFSLFPASYYKTFIFSISSILGMWK